MLYLKENHPDYKDINVKEFDDWLQDQDIIHELSSPYKHQSNSHAEVAVWNIKIYWPRLAATGQGWPQLAQLLTGAERMA